MKRFFPYVIGTVVGVLLAAAFLVGGALAATGCFPDTVGHWAETYVCWLVDNGIAGGYPDGTYGPNNNITRAEAAVMLQRMRSMGDTYFTFGPSGWDVNPFYSNGYILPYFVQAHFRSAAAGTILYHVNPVLPSSLYDTEMYIKGAQICYDASPGFGAVITQVDVEHWKTYDDGTTLKLASYTDTTDRSDAECRLYMIPTPSSFWPDNQLVIKVQGAFDNAAELFKISSTTVILSPSANPAGPLGPEDVMLQPSVEESSPEDEEGSGR